MAARKLYNIVAIRINVRFYTNYLAARCWLVILQSWIAIPRQQSS